MSVLLVLIAASLSLALLFLSAFIWSVRKGQFDDAVTPAFRILTEDETPRALQGTHDKKESL